jgi:DNA polymerase III epsilon subunit-like protein
VKTLVLYIPNENHKNLVFFDTEFNNQKLIQVAMIVYEAIEIKGVHAYLLKGSINLYIQNEINYFFTKYTGICADFLDNNGVPEEEARTALNTFVSTFNNKDTLFIAHGVKQDADLLVSMGVNISLADRYCTYNASKTFLNRDKNLRLIDVCNESGYFAEQHDAYSDAKNVVHAFSYLKLVEAITE